VQTSALGCGWLPALQQNVQYYEPRRPQLTEQLLPGWLDGLGNCTMHIAARLNLHTSLQAPAESEDPSRHSTAHTALQLLIWKRVAGLPGSHNRIWVARMQLRHACKREGRATYSALASNPFSRKEKKKRKQCTALHNTVKIRESLSASSVPCSMCMLSLPAYIVTLLHELKINQ
jgi:hypothetical protein